MKGLGAGGSPQLPRLTTRDASLAAPAAADNPGPFAAKTAGAPARYAAPDVKPEEEDFSYTYLAPARHTYELPPHRSPEEKNWRYLLSLGLRGAAALAVGYLLYHSDLSYLAGLARRRRK